MLVVSQADDLVTMAAVLVAGGLSNGLVQPAAGRLIAARVPGRRRSSAAGAARRWARGPSSPVCSSPWSCRATDGARQW
jgi:hypothetical protein